MAFPYIDFRDITPNNYDLIPVKPFSGSITLDESFLDKNPGDPILNNICDTNNRVPSVVDGVMGLDIISERPMNGWVDHEPDSNNYATDAFPVGDTYDIDMGLGDESLILVSDMCKQAGSIDPSVRIEGITMLNFMFYNYKEDLFAKENIDMVKAAVVNMVTSESPCIRDIGIKIACALWGHIEAMKKCIVRCNRSLLNNA